MKKVLSIIAVLALIFAACVEPAKAWAFSSAGEIQREIVAQGISIMTIPFIANKGQAEESVRFYARTFFGGTVFVTGNGEIVYSIPKKDDGGDGVKVIGFKEVFAGGRVNEAEGESISSTAINSFTGKYPSAWRGNIPTYGSVSMGEVYDGITVRLAAKGNNVEKLFYVRPQADPSLIRMEMEGIKGLFVNSSGELEAETELGAVRFTKPVAYQEIGGARKEVSAEYEIKPSVAGRHAYAFRLGEYDAAEELVIDPLLASTFIGGGSYDYAYGVAVDSSGNVYVAGATASPDYPSASSGAGRKPGGYDVFISKFNAGLTTLISTAFIGGSGEDYAYAVALDPSGNVYVAGATASPDFPVSGTPYDKSHNNGYDAFVSKFTPDLSTLEASSLIGGAGDDFAYALAINSTGGVYVAGRTGSSDYPVSWMPYDGRYNGGYDAFVSKFTPDLSTLEASSFIGGADYDRAYALAIDQTGSVYVAGRTASADYPTTVASFDKSYNGGSDAFVSKLDGALSNLIASTFIGGGDNDYGAAIAIDNAGNVYVAGATASSDYPSSGAPYNGTFNGGYDAFISKFDAGLASLQTTTFLGGSGYDYATTIAIDRNDEVIVAGYTNSSDYPTTADSYDSSHNGGYDVFISMLDNRLSTVSASTFMGASGYDYAAATAIDVNGDVYIAGYTYSPAYPVADGAYGQGLNGDLNDVFVSKLARNLAPAIDGARGADYDETASVIIANDAGYDTAPATTDIATTLPATPGTVGTSAMFTAYAYAPRIVIDANGNAIAVSYRDDGAGYCSYYTKGALWTAARLMEIGNAYLPRIAFAPNNNAIAVWHQDDGTGRYGIYAGHYAAEGALWGTPTLINTGVANAYLPQIAFAPNNNAIAVWHQDDGTGRYGIYAGHYTDGTGWGTPTLINTGVANAYLPRIAFTPNGNAIAVWYQDDGAGYYSYYTEGAGWGAPGPINAPQ
ncbi:MAG: SBBP repeat-containing protein [Deltaproteobacteria bacterium]|nr:SBBP repeat-containing protein [Deltaproteobacteria bacterium]